MNSDFVVSKYTYLFVSSKNKKLVYNSRSNSFFELSDKVYMQLQDCQKSGDIINSLDNQTLAFFIKKQIIVEERSDEDFLLNLQYETDRRTYSKEVLGITIVPTLGCNFSCHYCFEEHKQPTIMDEHTIEAVVNYIKSHSESGKLELRWYGGEPLMAINVIERLLDKITVETEIKLIKHSIITNGYYFNDKAIELFRKYPLNNIQITLDGRQERHDSIRKTRTNLPTYQRIIANIDRIINEFPNTEMHIRVNIERCNMDDYYEVAETLENRWHGKNVMVYPGFLRIDNEQRTAYGNNSLNRKEIAEYMVEVKERKLMEFSLYPELSCSKVCSATRKSSYIIGPKGEVYKCWNDVSDPNKVIGNIHEGKVTNKTLLNRYLVGSKWYQDLTCKACFFLPICSGACAWYTLRNKYENGQYDLCTCIQKVPDMLDKCLERHYESQMKNEKL